MLDDDLNTIKEDELESQISSQVASKTDELQSSVSNRRSEDIANQQEIKDGEEPRPSFKKKRPPPPLKDTEVKDDGNKQNVGRWTEDEHELFLEALRIYGKDWNSITVHVGSRDAAHCRSHAQKFFTKLNKFLNRDPNNEDEAEEFIDDAEIYMEILQRKVENPVKRKRRKKHEILEERRRLENPDYVPPPKTEQKDTLLQDKLEEEEDETTRLQKKLENGENIFMVQRDPDAQLKKQAIKNIKPSINIEEDVSQLREVTFEAWRRRNSG